MAERVPLSKRTRFEVFKRDGFRCVYCGSSPNDGPLHVDHVVAVVEDGILRNWRAEREDGDA